MAPRPLADKMLNNSPLMTKPQNRPGSESFLRNLIISNETANNNQGNVP